MNPEHGTEVVAATAADENYVVPLAVTVRSAINSLSPTSSLRLFVLDGGLTPDSRRCLMASWDDPRVSVQWIQPDFQLIQHLPVSNHLSVCAYLRLLLPSLLPGDIGKLIYFDSDMLIRRDLSELFSEPLGGYPLLAVQEMAAPWMDSEVVIEKYHQCRRFLSSSRPVANYAELGIRPHAAYFNTGLLVFDVNQWRDDRIAQKVLTCLENHRQHVLWCDQYALNVVFADVWRPLDVRWNQTAGVFQYPTWRESPLEAGPFKRLCEDPWIVHYCSPTKPWHYFCDHPFRQEFFEVLADTQWQDWRPAMPTDMAYKRWRQFRLKFRKSFRCMKANVRHTLAESFGRVA